MYVLLQLPTPPASDITVPDDVIAWAAAHPPPRREDIDTQEQWDAVREPWYATFMGKQLPPYGNNVARATAWRTALMRYDRAAHSHKMREEHAEKELQRDVAAREAERARQAAQDAEDAPLIQKLIDCERCHAIDYHVACRQWHHPHVLCKDAHLYPVRKLCIPLPELKKYLTGTMYIAGIGAVVGERAEWPFLGMGNSLQCKCLTKDHRLYWKHESGHHVPSLPGKRGHCASHDLCAKYLPSNRS